MRLIDADGLRTSIETDREASDMPKMWYEGIAYAINHIIHAPTADVVETPRWIPVEYRPPEFGKEVLISHKGAVSIDWLTQSEGWAYFFVSGVAIADIDAWMPLPEPFRKETEDG